MALCLACHAREHDQEPFIKDWLEENRPAQYAYLANKKRMIETGQLKWVA